MNIGYFGVIVPERDYWQGFFLNDKFLAEGRGLIATMQRENPELARTPSQVLRPLGLHADDQQRWIGALSAVIVEFALKKQDYGVGVASAALHAVVGLTHFIVKGRLADTGTYTEIENLPDVTTDQEVRDKLNADPAVIRAKQAILRKASATEDGQHRGRPMS